MACPAGRNSTASSIRFAGTALVAAWLIFAQPTYAQNRDTDAELEALIPDSAVANPDAWAKTTPDTAPAQLPADVATDSPLVEDGDFRLPWPDQQFELPELVALPPDPDLAQALKDDASLPPMRDEGLVEKVSERLTLEFPASPAAFPERDAFVNRFAGLSTIERLNGSGEDNSAQLGVRARTDADLLRRLLRIYGYYNPEVTQTVSGIEPGKDEAAEAAKASVTFVIAPGPRYRFGEIDLGDLPGTGADFPPLRKAFGIQTGDPLYGDRIVVSRNKLDNALGEAGYAFAKVGEPELLVDHRREEGDLDLPVTTGGRYTFDRVTSELPRFLSGKHLEEIARFDTGDLFKRSEVDDLRRAIIATGLVSSAGIALRETRAPQGDSPGAVALDVSMSKAPLRTIAGALGYDSAEGVRAEASWEHRNLFPPEGLLRLRGVAGTKEQLAGVTFRRNNFKGRDQVLTLDLYATNVKRDAYLARTAGFTATFEKLTTLIFQKPWVWSAGIEVLASNEREGSVDGLSDARQNYYIVALPLRGALDTTDNLLDPAHGYRAALRISPEQAIDGRSKATYVRIQADASAYLPITKNVVMAGRVRIGSIPGTAIDNIAPSRRFYAGGGGSVRGYGYQQIGPRDSLDQPSGGRSLTEFSIEARIKTGIFGGGLSLVPFFDAGSVEETVTPRFRNMRYGAGMGLRYATGFGPIRIDVGAPLNRRPGESPVAVYVSLGQAF